MGTSVQDVGDEPSRAAPTSGGREVLLRRVTEHLLEAGAQDLTLRGVAAAVGSSHRMLIYHFGTIDGLVTAVVGEVDRREQQALADLAADPDAELGELTRAFWRRVSAPELRPLGRLFFDLYGRLLAREGSEADRLLVAPWLDSVEQMGVARGFDPRTSRALARLGNAVTRGLILDLLATEDEEGVDDAHKMYAHLLGFVDLPPTGARPESGRKRFGPSDGKSDESRHWSAVE